MKLINSILIIIICQLLICNLGNADNNSVNNTVTTNNGSSSTNYSHFDKQATIKQLTPDQYYVTQENGTEKPYTNAYWNNDAPGIYVDVISGEPLFSSLLINMIHILDGQVSPNLLMNNLLPPTLTIL